MVKKSSVSRHNPRRMVLGIILLIVVVLAILELTNTTHIFHSRKATSGTIPTLPAATTPKNTSSSGSSSTSSSSPNDTGKTSTVGTPVTTPPNTGQPPDAPFGSFVSDHHPNLSGSPDPSEEQSICQTTPGAICYIQFTNGGVVKKLAATAADSNGLAAWSWDVKTAGFTTGSWQIEAVATLNGQTTTTKDSLALVVGP